MTLKLRDVPAGNHKRKVDDYLYVSANGQSWIVRLPRKNGGARREIGVGSVKTVSLALARKERDKLIEQWRNDIDPIAERQAAKAAAANRKTFAEVGRLRIAAKKSEWRTSAEGTTTTLDRWIRSVERDCSPIASKAIDEIGVADIKRVVAPYWDRGQIKTGRELLKRIEAIFDYAIAHGWRTAANPAAWAVFKQLFPSAGPKTPHPALPWSDAPKFVRQLRASPAIGARVVEFAILTASRSLETRGAKWAEIDLEAKTWTVPPDRLKMGKKRPVSHIVPLSDQAIALLERVKAEGIAGEYVFPAYGADGSRQARDGARPILHNSAWRMVKRIAGDVTMHGFRSTFRDWCGDHGIDRELAERSLAHKFGSEVEAAYARSTLVARRAKVMQKWADYCDGRPAEIVVPFRRPA